MASGHVFKGRELVMVVYEITCASGDNDYAVSRMCIWVVEMGSGWSDRVYVA